jgi:hypothetical protein
MSSRIDSLQPVMWVNHRRNTLFLIHPMTITTQHDTARDAIDDLDGSQIPTTAL